MLDKRISLNRKADFLPVSLSGFCTLVQWHEFIAGVGIVVSSDYAKIGGFQFAYQLCADAYTPHGQVFGFTSSRL